jgi:hypothetical protein
MSITAIARQAQGIRAGEVIAKLAEEAYFMRVDNRVNQPPPARPRDNEATSRSANNSPNRTRAELPAEPNRRHSNAGGPSLHDHGNQEVVPHRAPAGAGGNDPDGGGSDGGSSNHGANRRAGGSGSRGGRGHANSHASGASHGGYDARQKIEELQRKKSTTAAEGDGFPAFSPRLRNLLLPDKFKPLGITKYDAKQDPIQWLRCYAIENAGSNSDTKCLYFPFCLDQAPLTWLKSLDKHSIDKWDQLKEQFTSNFAGAMGRSGTRMDLAMIKQEQGETLRKYMRRFFDKRATVVDVTDKEVIDLFQDGLYQRRTFEDFGRRRPRSIPHLKDMITSWADEEDKANAKYDAIRSKTKQNQGGGSGSNANQGGRNNNNYYYYYSGPNRKRKPDNTVAAIQRPAKGNSKKNSGGFKDLLKEKCPWHPNGNHTTE